MKLKNSNVADPYDVNPAVKISDNTYFIGCIGATCFSGEPYDNRDEIL